MWQADAKWINKSVELDGLQSDLSELIHILHVTRRPLVKEVIQADIQSTLAKIESLEALLESQFESNISWARVAALKYSKSKYVKQKLSDPIQLTPNRFNLLGNDIKDDDENEDTLTKAGNLSELATHRVIKFKKDHKKQKVVNRTHKVVIMGDSHVRGCVSEVKQKLNSEYEIAGFTNPGSSMKDINESVKLKMAQLTKKDIIVLWGGSNDVAKKTLW